MGIDYTVIRREGRKTASVTVSPDNSVSIIVPAELDDEAIEAVIRRKSSWIYRKIAFNKEVRTPHKPKEYVSGEAFQYIGRNYRLRVLSGETGVLFTGGRFVVRIPEGFTGADRAARIAEELEGWYREHAGKKLAQRARMHAKRMGLKLGKVGVRDYRRQWGSCLQDGSILFNWKVILAPMRIIDYVVIHELCHLVHRDHSKEYWRLLSLYLPDYLESKEWLRVNGGLLEV
ncbi:M48 family metallopeptidase [Candidatus Bathyarchaeota archaeon]|jgi:predicted metal-dependent hydrolase|nr:M48 family metallopeptidase [Candidatus Bathyarchaeota archaeon]